MEPVRNLAFIGARGAGKSKLSRKFAKLTNRVVFSTDTLVSYEAGGKTIADIVAANSWANFREREYQVLDKICRMDNVVVDCGGGIMVEAPAGPDQEETLSTRKVEVLKSHCEVIYIKREMEWLFKKADKNANRPDLQGEYRQVLERRMPWYEDMADFILDMTNRDLEWAMDILLARYEART